MNRFTNGQNEVTTLTYDQLQRQVIRVLGNSITINTKFDRLNRNTYVEAYNSSSAPLALYTYTYDPIGNRLTAVEIDGSRVTYSYDPSYQLINEQRSGASAYNTFNNLLGIAW